jgi:hypothetical protein
MIGDTAISIRQSRLHSMPKWQILKPLFNRAGKSQIPLFNEQNNHPNCIVLLRKTGSASLDLCVWDFEFRSLGFVWARPARLGWCITSYLSISQLEGVGMAGLHLVWARDLVFGAWNFHVFQ